MKKLGNQTRSIGVEDNLKDEPRKHFIGNVGFIRTQVATLWKNRKLHHNAIYAIASTAVSVMIGIISGPILAWLLSRENYGALSYVNSVQGIILAFSAPGLANAIAYSVARGYEGVFSLGTYYRLRIYFRNSLFLLPLVGWYLWIENNSSLALLIALGAFFLPWAYAFDTGEQFLVGRWDFSSIFWRRTTGGIMIAASGIIAAFLVPNAISVFIGRGFAMFVVTIVIFFILLRSVRNNKIDKEFWIKSRDFNKVSVLGTIGILTDKVVLGKTGALSNLAGYSLALSITGPLGELSKSLIKITFGKMAKPRDIQQRRFWALASFLFVIIGVPLLLLVWKMFLPLVLTLFPKYPELPQLVPILLISSILGFGSAIGQTHSLFQSYKFWINYNLFRNASVILIMGGAVLFWGVHGAIYTKLSYSLADFLTYNFLLLRNGPSDSCI